ncbi:MutS domain V [Ruminococcus flavefaciens]|uniref:MutS domain V n=1 Tax=Ruminococcus flavefaciens TaxID=1265 RepID=A0A1H6J2I2_RUMFL|nr:hypothetical protein [Ruminococcus flavefaciens]SEH53103.1 MutS domain V [Ruminococcus flavefaciens]
MEAVIIISAIAALFVICMIVFSIRNKRAIDYYIRHSFGDSSRVKDDVMDRTEAISRLFENEKKKYNESELVDAVTWDDLDMKTVFFRADHTDSFAGEQCLYSSMHILGDRDADGLLSNKTVEFFDKNEEKRNKVRKILHGVGKPISAYYSVDVAEDIDSEYLPYKFVYPLLMISLLTFGILGIILHDPRLIMLCICNYFVNLVVHIFLKNSFDRKLETLFSMGMTINAGFGIKDIVPELSKEADESFKKLKKSASIMNLLNMKKSMTKSDDGMTMLMAYITDPFMVDFILYNIGLKEFEGKTQDYMKIFRFVGEIDCSIAIASFRRSLEGYCVPEINSDKRIEYKGLFHPLISEPVANDLTQEKNMLLTGSNASGKSTFIKAAAINLILGQSIFTCTAEQASIPRCGVITSMAVRDDLASGESYYIREIKYLKRMTEAAKDGRLLFFAIDEILKGTNTKERIAASKAILRYFDRANCMLMVATHDIELAEAFEGRYENYYFCEKLDEEDVVFDYMIHKGICRSSNAIKLLSVIGFPEEIINDALSEL